MALKNLSVRIGADTTGFERGLTRVKSGLSSLVKTGLALAGVGFGLKAIGDSMKAYIGLESSVMRVNGLFGSAAKYVTYFATNTARGFGMAESSAYQYAAVYGNLFRGITRDSTENSKVTIAMLKASAVVASKTGRTMEDVMDRIRSGLLGNTEAIEDLGINVNVAMLESTDAFKRMANGRSWEKLTFYEQQQVRTLAILEQAHKSFGDEVQRGSAFSLSVLGGAFKDLTTTAGQFVNAGLQPIIRGLTQLVWWATSGLKALAALMGLELVTADPKSTKAQTDAQAGLTDEIEATGKAAQQTAAGFDVFNDITKTKAGASGAAGVPADNSPFAGIAAPEFKEADTSWIDTASEKIKRFTSLFDFSGIKTSWANLKESLTPLGENVWSGLTWLWDNILVPLAAWTVNDAAPAFLKRFAAEIKVLNAIIETLKPLGQWLWDKFLKPFSMWAGDKYLEFQEALANGLNSVSDWIHNNQGLVQNITLVIGSFALAWGLVTLAVAVWNGVAAIATTVTTAFGAAVAFLTSPIGLVILAIGALIAVGVLLYKNWDTVKAKASELWEGIRKAFAPVGKFFGDMWEGIRGTFKSGINVIIDLMNTLIRGLNTIKIEIPSWSPIMPGKKFGINIPLIPKLASGGIAYGQVQAIVGDNFNARQDPEVIAPLSSLKAMILEAMLQKEIAIGNNREMRVTLALDNSEVLVDMLIDPMNQKAKNLGYAPVFKPAT